MTNDHTHDRAKARSHAAAAQRALLAAHAAGLPTDLELTVAEALAQIADADPGRMPPLEDVLPSKDPIGSLTEALQQLRSALSNADTLHEIACFGFAAVMLRRMLDRAAR